MKIQQFTTNDLQEVNILQPEGWPDISVEFRRYIEYEFCNPVKVVIDNIIAGVGCSIRFGITAWIAHIIVDEKHRNEGIGFNIVHSLINTLKDDNVQSISLIATELGEPVYKKAGFRFEMDYTYLNRISEWNIPDSSSDIIKKYKSEHAEHIYELDKNITGENRTQLLNKYLSDSVIYESNGIVKGYYLPNLGEGAIYADNSIAGIELMKLKYNKVDKAVIPSGNFQAIEFLMQNGFEIQNTIGKRMIYGSELNWKSECVFSRIGGNYG